MVQLTSRQKTLLKVLEAVVAVIILGVLFQRIQAASGFSRLLNGQKDWPLLSLALGLTLVAFSLSFVRWYLLVRGLNLKFHLRDAFRLGTLGFMFNQVSPGSIGGDLFKAAFIAREQPGQRTAAVATVFIDRVIGFYAMLIVSSLGIAFAGNTLDPGKLIQIDNQTIDPSKLFTSLAITIWCAALAGTLGLAFVLSPLATGKRARAIADRLPIVGHTVTRLIEATDIYRSRRGYLFAGLALALTTHCLLITAFWAISRGLPLEGPTFIQNASLVPIALVAGAVIPTPGGLGALEGSMESLYCLIGNNKGDGAIVALAYRAMTYVVAGIGACYYFTARKKVDNLMHDAEALADEIA